MPVFVLGEAPFFPHPDLSEKNGLLAVGGDLSPQRLINAYAAGIFPWYNEGDPILWWSPDPRFVLFPSEIKVSRSMRQLLKKKPFRITYDNAFAAVVDGCRQPRGYRVGTWIDDAMYRAY
ncbi:MAG: leucyl/phenylalanyl-tRNA--protein transferase, partial [Syntrophales bacterium]|nr:leucyl/phenylalanyl-tRNA--protein transferase [Syntrophales bacterium]